MGIVRKQALRLAFIKEGVNCLYQPGEKKVWAKALHVRELTCHRLKKVWAAGPVTPLAFRS